MSTHIHEMHNDVSEVLFSGSSSRPGGRAGLGNRPDYADKTGFCWSASCVAPTSSWPI